MINRIKELADEAINLQNKDRMDAVLREISAMCSQEDVVKHVTYGEVKQFDSEAAMVADLQGVPSKVLTPFQTKQQKGKK